MREAVAAFFNSRAWRVVSTVETITALAGAIFGGGLLTAAIAPFINASPLLLILILLSGITLFFLIIVAVLRKFADRVPYKRLAEVTDDSEFPVLAHTDSAMRQAPRRGFCEKRHGLLKHMYRLELALMDQPIDHTDFSEHQPAFFRERVLDWGAKAGLGSETEVGADIDSRQMQGGDMLPAIRQRHLIEMRRLRYWLEYHRHKCKDPTWVRKLGEP